MLNAPVMHILTLSVERLVANTGMAILTTMQTNFQKSIIRFKCCGEMVTYAYYGIPCPQNVEHLVPNIGVSVDMSIPIIMQKFG